METSYQKQVNELLLNVESLREKWLKENDEVVLTQDYKIKYEVNADKSKMKNLNPCEVCGASDPKEDTINEWYNHQGDAEGSNFTWCGKCGQCNYWNYVK